MKKYLPRKRKRKNRCSAGYSYAIKTHYCRMAVLRNQSRRSLYIGGLDKVRLFKDTAANRRLPPCFICTVFLFNVKGRQIYLAA